jgi:S-formylglutathione hydrolase FrmB
MIFAQQNSGKSFKIPSKNLIYADSNLVFVPQDYQQNQTKKFPLLFMLHGYSGNYKTWNSIINLQEYANKYNFIIICPDGLYDSWYLNSPKLPKQQYANFFFQDLYPYLTKNYRVDTKNIFITGLSMGGYGAFSLFLQRPDLFKSVAATSALFDLRLYAKSYGLTKVLGNFDSKIWEKYSLIEQIKKWKTKQKSIYFDCGKSDVFLQNNKDFHKKCEELGIKTTFVMSEGEHNRAYWEKSILAHFEFFSKLN